MTILFLLLLAAPAVAQSQQELEARIRQLESRLERAESLIRQLLDKQPTAIETAAATPPPPIAPEVTRSQTQPSLTTERMPQELLPNLGLIGASSSFGVGINTGPYSTGTGSFLTGGVSLPLMRAPGGQLLYEFSAGLTRSSSNLTLISNVAQVAGVPATFNTRNRVDLLQVLPFGFKYQNTKLNRFRLRPYLTVGLGLYVTISNQTTGLPTAPFGGALIGGQLTQAQQLTALGIPSGQGGINAGIQTGGGLEYRLRPRFSFGMDLRYNRLTNGAAFFTIAPRTTWHF